MQIASNYYQKNILLTRPETNVVRRISAPSHLLDTKAAGKTGVLPAFTGNPLKPLSDYVKFLKVKSYVSAVTKELDRLPENQMPIFRNLSMEYMEGLQYGIKVFKGLSMKDIQYLSENLHVIAVKRGCKNMCGYCYADAKPSKREMSWEDFKLITDGFKTLRKRLGNLPLFGENMTKGEDTLIYKSTELFYDSDCMDIAVKDKKGRLHDFIDLTNELHGSLGRKTVFDTSGWNPDNKKLQERAEKYAQYFAKPENMDKLNAFNLSFNCFNASYIAGVKALKSGDSEKYLRLKDKFTGRIANALFTFTPLAKNEKFNVMTRCFGFDARNAKYFDIPAMVWLRENVLENLEYLYSADLNGAQKYVKNEKDIKSFTNLMADKMNGFDCSLNSSGRMKQFMKDFNIKAPMQDHTETSKIMFEDLQQNGRYHKYLAMKLIDTDGRVYHMDYARFFPTEIQLNIKDKSATPKLANLRKQFAITKDLINRKEYITMKNREQ